MAKGAKRKTKWVTLSLANANTKTSIATGSDGEHASSQHQYGGGGNRNKLHNGTSRSGHWHNSKESATGSDLAEEHNENDHGVEQNGNRTDTSASTGSDSATGAGSERRPAGGNVYHRRRPPSYHSRSSWNGGGGVISNSTNGRSHYNRNGHYSNGGGYYGTGRRAHYETHSRRQPALAGTNKTTSGDSGDAREGGGNAINDDEYTRITTPRQDVLFKKGYLSRPKPATAMTTSVSNGTTASSSIAGTTSDGSDGGNGGSNSISTTESITSEYGGSYATDGAPLLDYPYPYIPCGYFTENGVFVMNGFAVDNNGFSYYNGGQTYIYPPNYNNCQPTSTMTTTAADSTTDQVPYSTNDKIITNDSSKIDVSNFSTPTNDLQFASCPESVDARVADPLVMMADGAISSMAQVPVGPVIREQNTTSNGELLLTETQIESSTPLADSADAGTVIFPQEAQEFSEDGFYQYTDYDFAQFYNCYPGMLMEQFRLHDDAGLPLYCGGEYSMLNEDVFGQQTSFKKRKKRFRTFEEIPGDNNSSYNLPDSSDLLNSEHNAEVNGVSSFESVNSVPSTGVCGVSHHIYHLNAEVQEFQPSLAVTNPSEKGSVATDDEVVNTRMDNAETVNKNPASSTTLKSPKTSLKEAAALPVQLGSTELNKPTSGRSAVQRTNRKKDLIESTLAFAAQNIDLSRPKTVATGASLHDSEQFWTTIDRNGRKKRVDQQLELQEAAAHEPAKEFVANESVKEHISVKEHVSSVASSLLEESKSLTCTSVENEENKTELQRKIKKKTQKHKRQQLRKSVASFHKQPLEGFQLIEPKFASSTAGNRRGRSCDKMMGVVRPETNILEFEVEEAQQAEKDTTNLCFPLIPIEIVHANGLSCVGDDEQNISDELTCDKLKENDSAGPADRIAELEQEDAVASQMVPSQTLSSVVDEEIFVNETETEEAQKQSEAQEANVMVSKTITAIEMIEMHKDDSMPNDPEIVADHVFEILKSPVQEPEICLLQSSNLSVDETKVPSTQERNTNVSVETHVLDDAANQHTMDTIYSEKPSQAMDAVENNGEIVDDGNGLESEDTCSKRGSVSEIGYTESIDSGLQSPAPCGGVASPEVSSMVSSIESQPALESETVSAYQSPLSQVVGDWLQQKLEIHERKEIFVLPNNPLLIQRLQRFHQLQRGIRREALHGVMPSDSDVEDDEYDPDDEDTDSDYMSDGQGKATVDTNPGTPLISIDVHERSSSTENLTGIEHSKPIANPHPTTKRLETVDSDNDRNNSENSEPSARIGSKRCLIM